MQLHCLPTEFCRVALFFEGEKMKENSSKSKSRLGLLLITIGIVYGDIGTSPMYVMKSILQGNGGINNVNEEFIIGALSLVIWTVTLLTTVKYVLIAMKADNHGEGGIFSLYALVKDYGKWIIAPAMFGGAALLADGLLTPAVTVTTAVEGLRSIDVMDNFLGKGQTVVVIMTLTIISLLFAFQHNGTKKIGSAFGPVMLIWFLFLFASGLSCMVKVPAVLKAFNPIYAIKVLVSPYNKAGFMILGSVFLATTGAEALYSDMGHVGRDNVYITWPFVKICLVVNYLGQGAWIISNTSNTALATIEDMNPFYMMLPENMRPFAVIIGALAAIIASQALITGSYTLVSEAIHLDLLPHLEVKYPSDTKGQIFIASVNKLMWLGCCLIVLYFRSGARIESAYGISITITMLMTTILLAVYLRRIRKQNILSIFVLIVFGALSVIFFVSCLGKFVSGGYISVILTLLLTFVEMVWYRGTQIESMYKPSLKLKDYIDKLDRLHKDESVPLIANNLVYIDSVPGDDLIDRDVLYSIFDKDHKRADAYWFVTVNVLNVPDTLEYRVNTYGTDFLFGINIDLGFRKETKVNTYLRQIVKDLQKSGELPVQDKKYSIYDDLSIGTFKFCQIKKTIS